ncbi:MAG: asparagine synthase (glutamine-hydrolyzing) [Candidatus Eisenbacteria bacterium]
MCGIAAIYSDGRIAAGGMKEAIARMKETLRHRGPDDSGTFLSADGRVGLGHTRLAIIDLSAAGHQPMSNENGRVWITYNGEIYNFLELRRDLLACGHTFKSLTDTEVLIHGYEQWGIEGLLGRLRGMFSLAVYDCRGTPPGYGCLVIARDRLGQKPLYYCHLDGVCVIASEIKAIVASGLVQAEIDPEAVGLYLRLGHIPAPRTIYRGIAALKPGYYLVLDASGTAEHRYYDLSRAYLEDSLASTSEAEAVERVHSCLVDTTRCHLISDVPVGVFLSGGIDSSSIVVAMREAGCAAIRSVSIVFPGTDYDESSFSRAVADRYHTDHTEVEIRGGDLTDHMERILAAMDQPTIDGVNTYFVASAAAQAGLKVALSGVGGDETFWGYPSFTQIPQLKRLYDVLASVPMGRTLAGAFLRNGTSPRAAKISSIASGDGSISSIYGTYRQVFGADQISDLLDGDFAAVRAESLMADACPPGYPWPDNALSQIGFLETTRYMANQLLRDTDIFSMVHSLEVRSPFVDHVLVELVAGLPACWKAGNGISKGLLIKALGDGLPEIVVNRHKRGFVFPFDMWLRNGLRKFTEANLSGSSSLKKAPVGRILDGFYGHRVHWSKVWSLVVINHWLN